MRMILATLFLLFAATQAALAAAAAPAVVAAEQAAGRRITLVDMHAALTPDDLLPDGVHPNRAGMEKIAAVWFAALTGGR
jgi:lysophospholipase L1-like esterase